jgi:23S rRNA U2552 (ribose-2'-O)-methylase RlmE/FtsJ
MRARLRFSMMGLLLCNGKRNVIVGKAITHAGHESILARVQDTFHNIRQMKIAASSRGGQETARGCAKYPKMPNSPFCYH